MNQYKCTGCGEMFKSLGGFDKHMVGSYVDDHPNYGRRCMTPQEMLAAGYEKKDESWSKVLTDDARARLEALRTKHVVCA